MVKPGSYKFSCGVEKFQNSRGMRYRNRMQLKLHQKKITGTHFIRMASWKQLHSDKDVRKYASTEEGTPFTLESATIEFDMMVNLAREGNIRI